MQTLWTLAKKDILLLFRDKFALFWIFAFPLMFSMFFGLLFGDSDNDGARGKISVAIVDEARTEASRGLVQRLADHESLRVETDEQENPRTHALEDSRSAVRKGRKTAYIRIPSDYGGDSPFGMFDPSQAGGKLEVGMDPSRSAERGFLQGILMQTMFGGFGEQFLDKDKMLREITSSREKMESAGGIPETQRDILASFMVSLETFFEDVDFDELEGEGPGGTAAFDMSGQVEVVDVTREKGHQPRTAYDITFPSAIVWGLMGVAVAFASTLVRERTQGTLLRLKIAPIGRSQVLAGKALGCFLTCLIVMVFLLGFAHLALGVRFDNYAFAALALVSTAACFTGLMMISAVLGKTEQAVAGAAWGVMMPFAMVGGGMIPLIAMPPWLIQLSHFSPFKWGITSIEGAAWRGFGAGDMLLPCAILIGTGVLCFGIGAWLFQRSEG